MDSKILTYTGSWFDVFDPQPEDVNILDIAHALSCTNRFGGHTDVPYSVAQHSVLASENVPEEDALWALLHDAAEAYLGDVPKPIKAHLSKFQEAEDAVLTVVMEKYNLPAEMPRSVHDVDRRLMLTEARDIMPGPLSNYTSWAVGYAPFDWRLTPYNWLVAKQRFLSRFDVLTAAQRARGSTVPVP